jgi:hypothetical protein
MPESSEHDLPRRLSAVEREMQRQNETADARERDDRDLVDTVGDEQQRERERAGEDG